jgi:hypothetical protein
MAHIFFERLEKRQSTQTLISSYGAIQPQSLYSFQISDTGAGTPASNISEAHYFYGVSTPPSYSYPRLGISSWHGSSSGMFGYSPYSPWSNPYGGYGLWSPYNPWGSGGFFGPLRNFFDGLFGVSINIGYPDFGVLYGVSPIPSTPTPVFFYGIGLPST